MMLSPLVLPRRDDEPVRRIQVGNVAVYPVLQLRYRTDPSLFFPDIEHWQTEPDAWYWSEPFVDDGRLVIDMGGFLLRTPNRAILVDAGVGNGKARPNPSFDHREDDWIAALAATGTTADQIDTVVFTHLHIDHVGFATTWTGTHWVPTFSNATHLVTAQELGYWTGRSSGSHTRRLGDYVSDSVLPISDAGLLSVVSPHLELTDEIRLFPAPGHTPGNICVEIQSQGQRAIFTGDMIHHALQLAFPEHSTDYCIDADQATDSRRQLLQSLGPGDLLFPAHFPDTLPGRVAPDGRGGFTFEPVAGEVIG